MRVKIETTADVYVEVEAGGKYAPDVMHDLVNRARELFADAVKTCDSRIVESEDSE